MENNDIMRSVRYALHLKNGEVVDLFKLGGEEITNLEVSALLKDENDYDFDYCTASQLHNFLDGLIIKLRGPKDGPKPKFDSSRIDNNIILRKLRIAFALKDTDVIDILKDAKFKLSKSELGAISRKPSHHHYLRCGDQLMRYFLKGLVLRYRDESIGK